VTLQFWHKRDIEQSNETTCFDAGILEISTNNGSSWTQLGTPDLLTDPYDGVVSSQYSNPLADLDAWCGVKDWTHSIVDVSMYSGDTVQFRYRLGSDSSVGHDGWYLDDVKVQSCAGGQITHVVTPVAGSGGTIAPSKPQTVVDGATTSFVVTPDTGLSIADVTGCGGSLAGNTYTTGPITQDCTVDATFAAVADVTISIDDRHDYAAYGMTMTYEITLTNASGTAATGISVSNALPPGLDAGAATWVCDGGAGATCTGAGTGALGDAGVVVPANGSVSYTLTAPVRTDAAGDAIDNAVTVTGAGGSHTANDIDTLVIFRGSFETDSDGASAVPVAPQATKTTKAAKGNAKK
jgi:uncharacterized repeat protein (TIGR01451 family)